jgi:hypothetical protein
VWNEYLMQVLAFVWVPTLLDALVPFAFLASELFMAHFVYNNLRGWLLTLGLIFVVGGAAQILTLTQARSLADENRDIIRVLAPHYRIRAVLSAVMVMLSICAFALYDVLRLGQAQFVIALLAFALVIVFSSSSVPFWNQVLAYARGEHRGPPQRSIQ